MRPSILNEQTPRLTSSGKFSIKDKSFKLKSCPVPPSAANGRRQGCAQSPRLPLREPNIALKRHCPETHMQSAPCTNASSSSGAFSESSAISVFASSRGSTAREKPRDARSRSPAGVPTVICVEACRGRSGQRVRARRITPKSCKISASAASRQVRFKVSARFFSSSSDTSVLSVMCARTPCRRQSRNAFSASSSLKLAAFRRALNAPNPK